jgi:Zn-dependent M28 family amino/carboxypeptidase
MRRFAFAILSLAIAAVLAGCAGPQSPAPPADQAELQPARDAVTAPRLLAQIKSLASDEFAGRQPGTPGEERTVKYLEEQFRAAGLEPGNPDGTYIQNVPLVGITAGRAMALRLTPKQGPTLSAGFGPDFVAWTKRVVPSVSVDAEMIFAGYGVQAPEFRWDDFKGLDVKGKIIVVLVNDPPVTAENIFGGKAMTYYGRWTYKYEKAAELGAAGCLIIHETGPAGYGWPIVQGRMNEQFDLDTPDKNMGRAAMEGWISWETAEKLMRMAGQDLAALKQAAVSRDFKPVALGVRAAVTIKNKLRTVASRNVIARLTGSDPQLRSEYVAYTAHWDHFGIGAPVNGDSIYNGAEDNASGTAMVLEIARAFKQMKVAPKRSLLFLAVTAEEQGLLGSQYYAEHPLYPLARTAAVINLDALNLLGRTRDVISVGVGNSTLDEMLATAAAEQGGRVIKPDAEPEKGFFYRSDHFNFAKHGVPALNPDGGTDYLGKEPGWGMKKREEYTANHYHRPSDDVKDYWDLSGLAEDAQLFLTVGYRVAQNPKMPEWKPGTEFKARREASLKSGQ